VTINSIDDKLRKTLLKHSGAHTQENSQKFQVAEAIPVKDYENECI